MPRQRKTKQRDAIEAVFESNHRPLSPNEVHDLARREVENLGIATVYRALNDMVEEKLLRSVELPGLAPRYEKAGLKHHHHFHCNACDKVFDLDGCLLKNDLKLPEGFNVTGHDITLSGTCPPVRGRNTRMNLLITGATGYVGGRLVPRLLEDGHSLRCLVRDPERLKGRPWLDKVEVFKGDVLKSDDLDQVMLGIDTAYYLIHSLGGGDGYAERDLQAARAFAQAAKTAGVKRIIYLGGLAKEDRELSEHLRSRQATGDALREAGVPVTEFRAGVVVGSGSLSFEMIRYLTERVPVMVCPSWVYTPAQPVGIRDVLEYLAAALSREESLGRIIEIGGADVVTYGTMMTAYAEARGLKRRMLPVPFLTPRLSSYWVHLVTPIPSAIARPLILGLKNENKVTDFSALEIFPDITPSTYQVALNRALARLDAGAVETRWTDAAGDAFPHVVLESREGLILEHRRRPVRAAPEKVFSIFSGIGGERGWFFMNSAWRLRGALDRMIGGVGLRRGRRDPDQLRVGDALDFWRVEAVEPGHLIRLRAEMKVPGKAWLEFQVEPRDSEPGSILTQTAFFAPKGLWGLMYWYALYPLHGIIFSGLIRQIVRRAEQRAEQNE